MLGRVASSSEIGTQERLFQVDEIKRKITRVEAQNVCGFRTNTQTVNGVLREYSSPSRRVPLHLKFEEDWLDRLQGVRSQVDHGNRFLHVLVFFAANVGDLDGDLACLFTHPGTPVHPSFRNEDGFHGC